MELWLGRGFLLVMSAAWAAYFLGVYIGQNQGLFFSGL